MVRIVKKAEERREDIIATACALFLGKGYDRTTMNDVMGQLHIAKGTIYHYFKSKEDLLDAVLDSITDERSGKMRRIAAEARGNALERLEITILRAADEDRDQSFIDNLHQTGNTGMHIRLLAKMMTQQAPIYEELLLQGCREGLFVIKTPLECAEFILSAIYFLTDIGIYPWTEAQLARRVSALPALIETQLATPPGSFQFLWKILMPRRHLTPENGDSYITIRDLKK